MAEEARPYLVELRQTTMQLEEKENRREKVLAFMNDAPFICFMKNVETGKYEFMNPAGLKILGLEREEVIGKTDLELFPEAMAQILVAHDIKLLKTRQPFIALEQRTYGNTTGMFLVSKFLVKNGNESIGGIAMVVPDTFRLEPVESQPNAQHLRQ